MRPGRETGKRVTPETALKRACVQYLQTPGCLTYPLVQQGIGAVRGLPDRIALKNGRTVYVEFKRPAGKLSPDQLNRKAEIEATGNLYLVVRQVEDLDALGDLSTAIARLEGEE
jgi:hypothetical protein